MVLKKFEPTTGKSKHVLEVSRRLVERGHHMHVITNTVKWSGAAAALAHLRVHQLGGSANALYFKSRRVAALVDSIGASLLEIHGGLSMTLFVRRFAQASGVPVVVNIHSQPTDLFREWQYLSWRDWLYDRPYIADSDDIIGLAMKTIGLKRFVSHPRIRAVIVPSRQLERAMTGVPGLQYLPSGAQLEVGAGEGKLPVVEHPTIIFFGRAVLVRGIDTLIDAFSRLSVDDHRIRLALLLLSDVDTERIRRKVAAAAAPDRIELAVGRRADLLRRLAEATIAAFPFRSSGAIPEQPLTLIEAMAAGLPVVTTSIGTVGEIVRHDVNGVLVRPADPIQLAEAIAALIRDPARRQRLGRAARETVRAQFNWDTIAERTLQIYANVARSA